MVCPRLYYAIFTLQVKPHVSPFLLAQNLTPGEIPQWTLSAEILTGSIVALVKGLLPLQYWVFMCWFTSLIHRCSAPCSIRHWWWVPVVAPMVGATLGAVVYWLLIEAHHPSVLQAGAIHNDDSTSPTPGQKVN